MLILPNIAFASDPTPLFLFFIAWPLLATSILFFILVFIKARNALFINLVLLIAHILVILWASDVGYMKVKGSWVWFSLTINLGSIILWLINTKRNDSDKCT